MSAYPIRLRNAGLLAIAFALCLWPVAVSAHSDLPARIVDVKAGPYPVTISFFNDPPHAGSSLSFAVDPLKGVSGPTKLTVTAVPGPGLEATIVRGTIEPHPDIPGGMQGEVGLPVAGHWSIDIMVDGPSGRGLASVPVDALAPPAIPVWLGWAVGLLPVYGFVGFILAQRRGQSGLVGAALW